MAHQEGTSLSAAFGRLLWMLVGPLALMLLIYAIIDTGQGWLTGADVGFFIVLGAMLLGRCLEFRGGHAQRANGEPATPADLRRYLITATVVGLLMWVAANVVANHWLAR